LQLDGKNTTAFWFDVRYKFVYFVPGRMAREDGSQSPTIDLSLQHLGKLRTLRRQTHPLCYSGYCLLGKTRIGCLYLLYYSLYWSAFRHTEPRRHATAALVSQAGSEQVVCGCADAADGSGSALDSAEGCYTTDKARTHLCGSTNPRVGIFG